MKRLAAAPFASLDEHLAIDLPGGRVVFTTRRGGVSSGPFESLNLGIRTDDDRDNVIANRERLAALVGIARERFAQGRQVHETTVRRWREPPDPTVEPAPADGQATSAPGVAAVVLVADCLPIALAAPGAVAMLHGGWRGLAGGIVEEGVRALRELDGDAPIAAAIGPGAGPCCYDVGEEVRAAFAHHGPDVRNGRALDLKLIARRELERAGVEELHDAGICTICADPALFFSHRRDGGVTGRQAGVVWRS
ncbi:MAG: purine-nucleoside/S-methyl-5-thioadenosine phosphorylase / adenosine deaminase [Thermoleophilales bacterium]|nr:purine-nucleoside/S-methyl-5-thioadenosine phosphorylase / adenosine deaminase [Thermoleophilales bacterium]